MTDVRVSDDGWGVVLDFAGSEVEIGYPEANMLQGKIRQLLSDANCTMIDAVGGAYGTGGVGVSSDEVAQLAATHAFREPLALLLGVQADDITRVDATGFIVGIQTKMEGGGTTTYSRKVQLS